MAVNWLLNEVTETVEGEEPPLVVVVLDELLLLQAAANRPPTSNIVASPRLVFSFKVPPPSRWSAGRAVAAGWCGRFRRYSTMNFS
jgi:hypothetical protein